jgi:hypothetical protein
MQFDGQPLRRRRVTVAPSAVLSHWMLKGEPMVG